MRWTQPVLAAVLACTLGLPVALAQGRGDEKEPPGDTKPKPIVLQDVGVGVSLDIEVYKPEVLPQDPTIPGMYVYPVKVLCGEIAPQDSSLERGYPLAPGSYRTAINIHNFGRSQVSFWKYGVIANPQGMNPAPIGKRMQESLAPGQALEVDCKNIADLVTPPGTKPPDFIKGFVVIETPQPLAVIGVYTVKNVEHIKYSPLPGPAEPKDPTKP